ncbi:MAG: hypothetical protein IK078_12235 [Lachnospiraceae bacterium]|nr:hypothetical protein [Lachnospiraceae bacterium]
MSKMARQLNLFDYICCTTYHGPAELMKRFNVSRRMLQRDLKAEYYALFPGSNERTRQRDFRELREAG